MNNRTYSGVTGFDIAIVCLMILLTGLMSYGFGFTAGKQHACTTMETTR